MVLFNTNLVFGPETFFMHYLAQCALVGKTGYANLAPKESTFMYQPVSSDDVANAVDTALSGSSQGSFGLAGPDLANLRSILDTIEASTGRTVNAPALPQFDYIYDFLYGTAADLNMSRMVEFLEENPEVQRDFKNTWHDTAVATKMSEFYTPTMDLENLSTPPLSQYKKMDLD
jgi:hypothetical protein